MSKSQTSPEHHDLVVATIAQTRYPFPDQTDWPASFQTIANAPQQLRSVTTATGTSFPDIVIVDADTDQVAELGEVEVEIGEHHVDKWREYAALTRFHPGSGAPHFFIYVPDGLATETMALLREHDVPFGGLRTWAIDEDGRVAVHPIVTPVDAKDHR
jgi:hypothetical protein